jgi:hypothetical protein
MGDDRDSRTLAVRLGRQMLSAGVRRPLIFHCGSRAESSRRPSEPSGGIIIYQPAMASAAV